MRANGDGNLRARSGQWNAPAFVPVRSAMVSLMRDEYDPLDIRKDDYEPCPPWYAWAFWGLVVEVGGVILYLSIFN
jgi:hypothetical protein